MTGAAGDVIHHDGNAGPVGNGFKMLVQTFLGGFVVVRSDHQGIIRPRSLGVFGEFQRLRRVVGAGAGHHRHPFFYLIYASFHHFFMLLMRQSGGFAGGAAGHDAVDTSLDLELNEFPVSRFVELTVLEGSDDGRNCSL